MNYGEILSDAFYIALRNRFLWVFGFFIGGATLVTPTNFGTPTTSEPAWALNLVRWVENNVGLAIFIFVSTVLVFIIVFLALYTLCRAALTDGVGAIARGESRRFGSTLRGGLSFFWRALLQVLLLALIWVAVIIPVYLLVGATFLGLSAGIAATASTAVRVVIALFCVLAILLLFAAVVVVAISLHIVGQLALRDLILGSSGIVSSIGNGYRIFRRNIGRTLLLLGIQFGIAFGAGIVLAIVVTVLGLLLSIPVTALSGSGASTMVAISGSLLLSLPVFVVGGFLGTFYQAYWTLAYLRLSAPDTQPPPG